MEICAVALLIIFVRIPLWSSFLGTLSPRKDPEARFRLALEQSRRLELELEFEFKFSPQT